MYLFKLLHHLIWLLFACVLDPTSRKGSLAEIVPPIVRLDNNVTTRGVFDRECTPTPALCIARHYAWLTRASFRAIIDLCKVGTQSDLYLAVTVLLEMLEIITGL